jgi:hypothetical protein
LALGLAACGEPEGADDGGPRSATWLESFSYEWDFFNHRLSFLDVTVDGASAAIGVVGGTSTTGVVPTYEDGCESDGCKEFPFYDNVNIEAAWGDVTTENANFVRVPVELLATSEGVVTSVEVALDEAPRGEPVALIAGIGIDTDHPLAGESTCYQPAFGWLPRAIALSIDDVALTDDDAAVEVVVSASFEAGSTLEDERVCVDESAPRAVVPIRVDVLVVFAPGTPERWDISQGVDWDYGSRSEPVPQDPPALQDRDLAMDEPIVGWTKLDWRFHEDDPDLRGAYLRTLTFQTGEDGRTGGSATNYSPGTQLSGFDYRFEGGVVAVDVGGTVSRHSYAGQLPVQLDGDGRPVLHPVP